ncbi:serine/threonine-protein kinase [Paenarthrobacter nitroguajacolicus]|uniref:serine/threonine-protein kinase n=1 Tax=Paenarthrobacter nitroguajacolicus TaxID=211146 RepID=UPI0028642516|nr:serine/threonine-protein kinase [Paenarthrobacter nitroguajacolicus]MDR6640469.1 serine/threonine protein kinase [Paenarthrobacter nitroguajacolicus]
METLDSADTPPHLPGYRASRQLGKGASSTVWLARRDSDGERFAVKCVKAAAHDRGPGDQHGDISHEAGALLGVKHKHLVGIHEVLKLDAEVPGALGIVMDYAAGGSLANLVSGRGRLRVGEAITILGPLAQALDYLHSQGVVHGDVSPGNILFTAEGMPLLADFGIAARVGDAKHHLDVGTPGFTDPVGLVAVGQEDGALRPERDLYSLAAVGWFCLTGSVPETATDRPPLSFVASEVPRSLAGALEAALDPDPRMRPSAREFSTAVFRSAAPEAVDLVGAVHSSVIPDLLTRRQSLDRTPRRSARWFGNRRPVLTLGKAVLPKAPQTLGRHKTRKVSAGIKGAVVLGAGMLVATTAWGLWGQGQPSVPLSGAVNVSGPGLPTDGPESTLLPESLNRELHSDDLAVAVPALAAVRDLALRQGHVELLAVINAPGSPAEAADRQMGEHLRTAGTVFAGLATTVTAVTIREPPQPDHAMVGIVVATSAYEERLSSGSVVRSEEAGTPQDLRLHLVRRDGRWQIVEVLAGATG